jgi:hypothetical protein
MERISANKINVIWSQEPITAIIMENDIDLKAGFLAYNIQVDGGW